MLRGQPWRIFKEFNVFKRQHRQLSAKRDSALESLFWINSGHVGKHFCAVHHIKLICIQTCLIFPIQVCNPAMQANNLISRFSSFIGFPLLSSEISSYCVWLKSSERHTSTVNWTSFRRLNCEAEGYRRFWKTNPKIIFAEVIVKRHHLVFCEK